MYRLLERDQRVSDAQQAGRSRSATPAQVRAGLVERALRSAISEAGGSIDFERFMEIALYADGCGYYSAAPAAPGTGGDFTTAPELAAAGDPPVLASALASLVAPALRADPALGMVEVGPGSGSLARDLLAALDDLGALPRRYLLVDRSPALQAIQRSCMATLPDALQDRVEFAAQMPGGELRDVVIANELLDALPVRRFEILEGTRAAELGVGWNDARSAFEWCRHEPMAGALAQAVACVQSALEARLPAGYRSEIGLRARRWVDSTARTIASGALLLVDYGYACGEYYHPQRSSGTLRCFRAHRAYDDPLSHAGVSDISAHVDFTAIARAGKAAGLALAGYQTQADFVMASGVLQAFEARYARRGELPPATLAAQLRKLMLPGEMGELVKVMLLDRDTGLTLPGRDRRARLLPAADGSG